MISLQAAGSRKKPNQTPANERILICTDLDRTLLPNGMQQESPRARERFRRLASRPEIATAYVTGRHRELVLDAIEEYQLEVPDYVIGDVGTSIYSIENNQWHLWNSWHQEIGVSWHGLTHDALAALFTDLESLQLQESEKQNTYKLSYYLDPIINVKKLLTEMQQRLNQKQIAASLIWSVDETTNTGLLDILPAAATKSHAVEFLMSEQGYNLENTLYAGDSGNDLPVLTSPIHSVLVANATNEVRQQALQMATVQGTRDALYLAHGNLLGMNGNYSAGILEGCVHYMPETLAWIDEELQRDD
ncbi:MAG: HAD-IIB family hydrolase [Halobacteria archaeon]|nr:HAD-IIB family hydrolase [Halobacteria archaeon]